jgi:hypothetical protein
MFGCTRSTVGPDVRLHQEHRRARFDLWRAETRQADGEYWKGGDEQARNATLDGRQRPRPEQGRRACTDSGQDERQTDDAVPARASGEQFDVGCQMTEPQPAHSERCRDQIPQGLEADPGDRRREQGRDAKYSRIEAHADPGRGHGGRADVGQPPHQDTEADRGESPLDPERRAARTDRGRAPQRGEEERAEPQRGEEERAEDVAAGLERSGRAEQEGPPRGADPCRARARAEVRALDFDCVPHPRRRQARPRGR